jgi:hypothetical protein
MFAMLSATITQREDATMKRGATLIIGLLTFGLSLSLGLFQYAGTASGQSGAGWVTLFDGKNLGDWNKVGETNWRVEDGAIVADKRTSKGPAYLLSKNKYKDFQIYVEFWASDDANSGIFCAAATQKRSATRPATVNIFDQRKDLSYGTGSITRHVEVTRCPRPAASGTPTRSP